MGFFVSSSLLGYFIATPALAQVPAFLNPSTTSSVPGFIKGFYDFSILIAGILAVGAIIVGGIMYSVSGAVDKKGEGKGIIMGAIWGLVLLLGAYVILKTVNPRLVELENPGGVLEVAGFERCTEKIIKIPGVGEKELPKCNLEEWPVDFNTGYCKCYTDKEWITEYNLLSKDEQEAMQDPPVFNNGSIPSVGGSCFPVEKNSFDHVSWNWGNCRDGGKVCNNGNRCHAGIDIYTKNPSTAIAIAPGKVVAISYSFTTCKRGTAGKVVINHGDYTVNYGEVNANGIKVKVGDSVQAGTILGPASVCGMLHFELYTKGTANSSPWYPPPGKKVKGVANYCRDNYLSAKPPELLDPTNTLKDLQSKLCGN